MLIRLFQLTPTRCDQPRPPRPKRHEFAGRASVRVRPQGRGGSERPPWVAGAGCGETRTRPGRSATACRSRIRCQAATGSWTRSLQWQTQRTRFRSAGTAVYPLGEGQRRMALQRRMAACRIVADLELGTLAFQITGIPEQHRIEKFSPHRPDQTLDEGV